MEGVASLNEDAREELKRHKEVKVIEGKTLDIIEKFNELSKTKKVAAIIHTTC